MWRLRPILLIVAYLALLAFSVFGPSPGGVVHDSVGKAHRIEAAARARAPGAEGVATIAPDGLVRVLNADDLGNIALFAPFGLLFPVAVPTWRRRTIVVGLALSATIELVQLVFLSWRISAGRDVLFNVLGTALGFLVLLGIEAAMRRWPRLAD